MRALAGLDGEVGLDRAVMVCGASWDGPAGFTVSGGLAVLTGLSLFWTLDRRLVGGRCCAAVFLLFLYLILYYKIFIMVNRFSLNFKNNHIFNNIIQSGH